MTNNSTQNEMRMADGTRYKCGTIARKLTEPDGRAPFQLGTLKSDWAFALLGVCAFFTLLTWIV